MYRILMPIDTDASRVDAQTRAILELLNVASDVEVTLLHVFEERAQAEETSPSQLTTGREARDRLTEAGATIQQKSRTGNPAEEILQTAREMGSHQIVLGGRKRSPLGAVVFGSVSQDIIREAPLPVTVTGSAEGLELPSHRCTNCGEVYYTRASSEIETCRRCGGVNVEAITDETVESAP